MGDEDSLELGWGDLEPLVLYQFLEKRLEKEQSQVLNRCGTFFRSIMWNLASRRRPISPVLSHPSSVKASLVAAGLF